MHFYRNKVWVFDDIIDEVYQNEIEETLFSNNFSWYFIQQIASPPVGPVPRPAFQHQFVHKGGEVNSDWNEMTMRIVNSSCKKIGLQYDKVHQGRSFFQLPLSNINKDILDPVHIDDENIPHMVVLYYVKDSDGDTIIYNNHYEKDKEKPLDNNLEIKKTVTPKKGRVVIFDGWFWHTAQQPSNDTRCVINYNVI
tara:strand:+ start:1141 stop:1725 length:585 start_codon:yes stop_codon:yes gene_type:complete